MINYVYYHYIKLLKLIFIITILIIKDQIIEQTQQLYRVSIGYYLLFRIESPLGFYIIEGFLI